MDSLRSPHASRVLLPALPLALLLALSGPAQGQRDCPCDCFWDIDNDSSLNFGGYVVGPGTQVGQEFVPDEPSIDRVELRVNAQGPGANAFVRIREGSITGRVVGSSATVGVEVTGPLLSSPVFAFAQPVPVVPGNLYVLEVAHGGGSSVGVFNAGADNYPSGDAIQNGLVQPGADLWFRVGQTRSPIVVPDQSNDAFSSGGSVLSAGASLGQEFVPDHGFLEAVELRLNVQSTGTAVAFVRIRKGSLTGDILGTSDFVTVEVRGLPVSPRFFRFAQPVPLTPGATHVIELVHAGGVDLSAFYTGFGGDPYPDGRALVGGVPSADDDFWFREGADCDPVHLPEQENDFPTAGALVVPTADAVGQEFVPTTRSLDLVELELNTQSAGAATVFVRIREGDINGPIRGESAPVEVSSILPRTRRRFFFAQPAPLRIFTTHVLEVVHVSGPRVGVFLTGFGADTYASGRAISFGTPRPTDDLWFRLGSQENIRELDQESGSFPAGGYVFPGTGPTGQEFTPSGSSLDVVELFLNTQDPGVGNVFLRIRETSITGNVIGTSDTLSVEILGLPSSKRRFRFEPSVPLQAGSPYVLEVVHAGGPRMSVSASNFGSNTYAAGRAIFNGSPVTDTDLWFRLGRTNSCASTRAAASPFNVAPNPFSYTAGPPVVGEPWLGVVDVGSTGHSFAQIFAFASPATLPLAGGQVVLGGGAILFRLPITAGPLALFQSTIPNDCSLVGRIAYTQAVHFLGTTPFALSNAQDLRVGY